MNKDNGKKDIDVNIKRSSSKFYFSYSMRIILCFLLSFIFLIFTIIFSYGSLNYYDPEIINYEENSDLDYKVYLKENDFYEENYLEKDMLYVASLIDRIVIDFNYLFTIDKNIDINFDYDIVAKLIISNELENKIYFEKEYMLLKNKQYKMINDDNYNLTEQISVDYDYYNSLANNFRKSYGIDADSNLLVYLKINNNNDNGIKLNDESLMLVKIPLSQKSVDIELDYTAIDNTSYLVSEKNIILDNIIYIVFALICLIISLISIVKFVRLLSLIGNKKSDYDKYIKKIMNEYDRLIVENITGPKLDDCNIIKIVKFEELLDVRDNLKLPIMYFNVVNHQKCYFYIKHDDDLYLLTVKSVDFE